jgi:hypothetical protein
VANVNVHSREGEMDGATMTEHIIMPSPCVKPQQPCNLQANDTVKSDHMASVPLTGQSSTISCSTVSMEVETLDLDCDDNANMTVSDATTDAKNVGAKKKVESKYYALE